VTNSDSWNVDRATALPSNICEDIPWTLKTRCEISRYRSPAGEVVLHIKSLLDTWRPGTGHMKRSKPQIPVAAADDDADDADDESGYANVCQCPVLLIEIDVPCTREFTSYGDGHRWTDLLVLWMTSATTRTATICNQSVFRHLMCFSSLSFFFCVNRHSAALHYNSKPKLATRASLAQKESVFTLFYIKSSS